MKQAEVVCESGSDLGECPLWDHRVQRLYWVDILQGKIFGSDDRGNILYSRQMADTIGSIALTDDVDRLILAMGTGGVCLLDLQTSEILPLSNPEKHLLDNRFNDGKCDPSGRFWVGSMQKDCQTGEGSLYCLDSAGDVHTKLTGLTCPNGLVWNQQTMYFIDSAGKCIESFDYTPESGEISNRRTIYRFSDDLGIPDGMTLDRDGNLWVALWGGNSIIQVDPVKQSAISAIQLPVSQVTSCTFGGKDLKTLYITSASNGLNKKDEPLAGHIFSCELDVGGLNSCLYKQAHD